MMWRIPQHTLCHLVKQKPDTWFVLFLYSPCNILISYCSWLILSSCSLFRKSSSWGKSVQERENQQRRWNNLQCLGQWQWGGELMLLSTFWQKKRYVKRSLLTHGSSVQCRFWFSHFDTHQDYVPSKGNLNSRSGSGSGNGSQLRRMSQDMEADNFSAEDDLSE